MTTMPLQSSVDSTCPELGSLEMGNERLLTVPVNLYFQGTEVVPRNARSHSCLLSGVFIGDVKVLVRLSFGLSGPNEVAMKLAVRSDDPEISDKIHEIVASG